jgi:hypothetical protein
MKSKENTHELISEGGARMVFTVAGISDRRIMVL